MLPTTRVEKKKFNSNEADLRESKDTALKRWQRVQPHSRAVVVTFPDSGAAGSFIIDSGKRLALWDHLISRTKRILGADVNSLV